MIDLNDITYLYPDGTPGLNHVSLHLQAGECCVLTGPNGSGKSTLFRILNGLAFPQSGSYLLDDQTITESYLRNKKKCGSLSPPHRLSLSEQRDSALHPQRRGRSRLRPLAAGPLRRRGARPN